MTSVTDKKYALPRTLVPAGDGQVLAFLKDIYNSAGTENAEQIINEAMQNAAGSSLKVTITKNGDTYTADKTKSEIDAAITKGTAVLLLYENNIYQLSNILDTAYCFTWADANKKIMATFVVATDGTFTIHVLNIGDNEEFRTECEAKITEIYDASRYLNQVPTLASTPTENTLTWNDSVSGTTNIPFAEGSMCKVANGNAFDVYRLFYITSDNKAVWVQAGTNTQIGSVHVTLSSANTELISPIGKKIQIIDVNTKKILAEKTWTSGITQLSFDIANQTSFYVIAEKVGAGTKSYIQPTSEIYQVQYNQVYNIGLIYSAEKVIVNLTAQDTSFDLASLGVSINGDLYNASKVNDTYVIETYVQTGTVYSIVAEPTEGHYMRSYTFTAGTGTNKVNAKLLTTKAGIGIYMSDGTIIQKGQLTIDNYKDVVGISVITSSSHFILSPWFFRSMSVISGISSQLTIPEAEKIRTTSLTDRYDGKAITEYAKETLKSYSNANIYKQCSDYEFITRNGFRTGKKGYMLSGGEIQDVQSNYSEITDITKIMKSFGDSNVEIFDDASSVGSVWAANWKTLGMPWQLNFSTNKSGWAWPDTGAGVFMATEF